MRGEGEREKIQDGIGSGDELSGWESERGGRGGRRGVGGGGGCSG